MRKHTETDKSKHIYVHMYRLGLKKKALQLGENIVFRAKQQPSTEFAHFWVLQSCPAITLRLHDEERERERETTSDPHAIQYIRTYGLQNNKILFSGVGMKENKQTSEVKSTSFTAIIALECWNAGGVALSISMPRSSSAAKQSSSASLCESV